MHYKVVILQSATPVSRNWEFKNWSKMEKIGESSFLLGGGPWAEFDLDQMLRHTCHSAVDEAIKNISRENAKLEREQLRNNAETNYDKSYMDMESENKLRETFSD